ncbi:hypothetical protein GCM10010284_67590 [Streptomyces rubiginosohelvolus]|uniref:hypothetical protein n=1 Tax=Streptomyces rubiginosohelvolus TaxID=67362 RepID=UPI0019C87F66|nr:hypothetical protein [Streptomyces rubiginosohelvolus]GGS25168.1 hypothetical protein GCM10010284_67590 [Streptomyces rubiginosohelvolus]
MSDGGGADPTASALKFAKSYQEAVNSLDWLQVCHMRTERYRHGTVKECVANNEEPVAPAPSESETSAPPPLVRADGSTVGPKEKPTASGPDRAQLGPIKASGAKAVPAFGDHPAGVGVMVEWTYTWPNESGVSKDVLRLVRHGDKWLVDQTEEVADSDEAHGDPVGDALMRS